MSKLPWIIGGGALAAYWWTREHRGSSGPLAAQPYRSPLPGRWVWPVASWNGRAPVISDGFNSSRRGLPRHGGVDIMFRRHPGDPFAPATSNGTKLFVMPDDHAVLAASDGVVWSAMKTRTGNTVVIDHGPRKAATLYAHLDKMLVTPTANAAANQRVHAGQVIGTVGFNPLDGEKLNHLHFEVWLGGPNDRIDPSLIMRSWKVLADPRAQLFARNGGFTYRPVGFPGDAYPQWVRDLRGKSGVYVIREDGETVYVGSSLGRLYDTLTRHFQVVRHEAQEVPMT